MITHQRCHSAEDVGDLFRAVEQLIGAAYMASPSGHEAEELVTGPVLIGAVIHWADYAIVPAAEPEEYVLLRDEDAHERVSVIVSGDAGDIAYGMRGILLPLVTAALESAAWERAEEMAGVIVSGDQPAEWVFVAGYDSTEWWPDDGATALLPGVMTEADGSADTVCAWSVPARYVAHPGRDGDPDPLDSWLLADEDTEWSSTYGVTMPGTAETRAAAARVLAEQEGNAC